MLTRTYNLENKKQPSIYFFYTTCAFILLITISSIYFISSKAPFIKTNITPINWHAHELFFGGFYVFMFGHLLTVSSSWIKQKMISEKLCFVLIALFFISRFLIYFFGNNIFDVVIIALTTFFLMLRFMKDHYNRSIIFTILSVTLLSKIFFYLNNMPLFKLLSAGVIRLFIILIIGRMWGIYARHSLPQLSFKYPKVLHYTLITGAMLLLIPLDQYLIIKIGLLGVMIFLLSIRFGLMLPMETFRKPELLVFILSFFWLIYSLILEVQLFLDPTLKYYVSPGHMLYMGSLGHFMLGMMIRFTEGYYQKAIFSNKVTLAVLVGINFSLLFRIFLPMYWWDANRDLFLMASTICWTLPFLLYIKKYTNTLIWKIKA